MSAPDLTMNKEVGRTAAKIVLFVLPRIVGGLFLNLSKHHLLAGLTVIAGVLLQALVPPRKKMLLPLFALAVGFTVIYSVFWK